MRVCVQKHIYIYGERERQTYLESALNSLNPEPPTQTHNEP